MTVAVRARDVHWKRSWRVIATRYPETNLYERIASGKDLDAVNEIEALTNDRLRQTAGEINLLRPGESFSKGCPRDVMASFVYRKPGRFSNPDFGAYYTAGSLQTAAFEAAYHYMRFLQDFKAGPVSTQTRVIRSEIQAALYDIRGMKKALADLYRDTDYEASQKWAYKLWNEGAQGIVYDSLRDPEGHCAAVFSPQTISHCHKDRVLLFDWNGRDTISIHALQEFLVFPPK